MDARRCNMQADKKKPYPCGKHHRRLSVSKTSAVTMTAGPSICEIELTEERVNTGYDTDKE